MTSPPTVSVIIRTYNRASMLKDALESVLGQTLPPSEILVVDDASADETAAVVNGYGRRSGQLRYLRLPVNVGMYRAARIGFEECTGDCVAFLDSDDVWLPEHLEKCVAKLREEHQIVMAFSRYGLMDAEGRILRREVREPPLSSPPLESILFKKVIVQPSRTVYSRSAVGAVGGIPIHDIVGDWVLNVLIASTYAHGIACVPARTVLFRVHGAQSYTRPERLREALLQATSDLFERLPPRWKTMRPKVDGINLLQSSVFLWQAGKAIDAWKCLMKAVRLCPTLVPTRTFAGAIARLAVPSSLARVLRIGKRAFERRRSAGAP